MAPVQEEIGTVGETKLKYAIEIAKGLNMNIKPIRVVEEVLDVSTMGHWIIMGPRSITVYFFCCKGVLLLRHASISSSMPSIFFLSTGSIAYPTCSPTSLPWQ